MRVFNVLLDVLLPIEEEAKHGAEEDLDAIARNTMHHVPLELLGAELRKGLGERVVESAPKHDNEL